MIRELAKCAAVAAGLLATQVTMAGASGAMIGRTCNGCHGTDGVSQGYAPSLKGLPANYLKQTMQDFKSDKRPSTIMGRIAKGYSTDEIAAVAQYFGGLK